MMLCWKPKEEKFAELESYKKSNEQLVGKAIQISELLVTLENDREGEKLIEKYISQIKNRDLPSRLTDDEKIAHAKFIETLGDNAIWKKIKNE